MIFQGLFNIISLYLKEIDLFYNSIDENFLENFEDILFNKEDMENILDDVIVFCINRLVSLGFDREELEIKFIDPFLELSESEKQNINSTKRLYEKKVAPLIYEIFLEKIVDYLVNSQLSSLMLDLKSTGLIPIEFIMELKNFKAMLEKHPNKTENLRKYIHIKENIVSKFCSNKCNIESIEDLSDPQERLQLTYLLFRIIDFFHLQKIFDFSHIKDYLKNNIDEWLTDIPLITLKNPDIYFCGIYLANHLGVDIDKEKVYEFLRNLAKEAIDEYTSPLMEATDGTYYFIKSLELMDFNLPKQYLDKIMFADSRYFESSYLKDLETSQLVVILKLYHLLGYFDKVNESYIYAINEEIERRIYKEGIRQYRSGFFSSEATYYVLFWGYMRNSLQRFENLKIMDQVVSRIYRNLEVLDFCAETNYDLVSELFYSCETLKLFNCVETKEMIIHLAKYLFPKPVVEEILGIGKIGRTDAKFRHLRVNRITGETIYPS
jgi:hypothetical protein